MDNSINVYLNIDYWLLIIYYLLYKPKIIEYDEALDYKYFRYSCFWNCLNKVIKYELKN